ncbi:S46 family peptidase [Solitalea koreensis]|uniref:Dipeptidyl-peptidase n=1 Tax=Solitalea koreensis TaxID=543615 RepID=A0A521BD59_9SPHI|nr:S46 family peptidase [Solitalea koreensis]SMO45017.1 Peptidase S46 [Solitalea koreensis]
MKKYLSCLSIGFILIVSSAFTIKVAPPDEGMYPLSEIKKLDLKKAGLKIDQSEIYNPNGISLIDALVQISGCTGSFVSNDGLIITNHHCAFSAVQLASTPEKNYLENGFVARTRGQEIEAKGLTVRITDSYEDVSDKILNATSGATDPAERIRIIKAKSAELEREAETKDNSIKAQVSEMFIGKSYVLFKYKTIKDIRLVYIPHRGIGEFGGETDNWVWPRHTGDFSFVRAYVAKDGSPASYSKDNVPYKPKRFLKVNPAGVNENDFAFILGYPGRTFRHRPAQYLEYQEKFLLPYTADLYTYENQAMTETGAKSTELELKQATRIKRNANTLKNYSGKLKGMRSIGLVDEKRKEDEELHKFINGNANLKAKYGSLMGDIDHLYSDIFSDAQRDLWLSQIYNSTNLLSVANIIATFKKQVNAAPDKESYYQSNKERFQQAVKSAYETFVFDTDKRIFKRMMLDGFKLPKNQQVNAVSKLIIPDADIEICGDQAAARILTTKLIDPKFTAQLLNSSSQQLLAYEEPITVFVVQLNEQIAQLDPIKQKREGTLNKLMGDYVAVKELYKKKDFIPDANSTLRLTYGYIRGYSPVDATYYKPFTGIKGIIEKGASGDPDFSYPSIIRDLFNKKDFGQFKQAQMNDVPVALLYNMDTTGGNSGSPIMNAYGELIGVNYDRAFSATINDFAWNESYSRSIGVDIRYVLWVAQKVDKADFILKELGVKVN